MKPDPTKPAETQTTQQAKNVQSSETSPPIAKPAETTEASVQTTLATTAEFVVAIEAVAVDTGGNTAPDSTNAETAVATDQIADAGDALISVTTDGNTTDVAAAAIVAVAVSTTAPVNMPAAVPSIDPAAITTIDLQATIAAPAKAAPNAPADPVDTPAADPETAKRQAVGDAAVGAPADETVPDDSQKAAKLTAASSGETSDTKSPALADRKAEPGQVKPEHHADATRPADAQPPRDATQPADIPAEQKAPAPHQPQAQVGEHAALTARATATDARPELPATAAAPAQVNAGAPAPPFNPAAHIPPPLAMSPLTALRLDNAADNAIPVAGLAVEIVARAHDGLRRFEIRLDPPELGRIDVRLDVDHGGKVTSRLTVERAETLDLLRRDAPSLERALQHAGLNTEGGLEFSLRDRNFANREQAPRDGNPSRLIVPDDEAAAAEAARRGYGRMIGLGGGVDIRV